MKTVTTLQNDANCYFVAILRMASELGAWLRNNLIWVLLAVLYMMDISYYDRLSATPY